MKSLNLVLGRAFGIEVLLHWSFLLLPAGIIWLSIQQGDSGSMLALRLVLLGLILASVFWHELAHALAGRALGIPTRNILLTPICGLARLERAPDSPRDEIIVAMAGPLANGLVAAVAAGIAWTQGESIRLDELPGNLRVLPAVFWVNLALFVLNLIPVFPMDGGRVLRALLAGVLGPSAATLIAARLGQVASVAGIGIGVWSGNPALVIIGVFLLVTAEQEIRWSRLWPPGGTPDKRS